VDKEADPKTSMARGEEVGMKGNLTLDIRDGSLKKAGLPKFFKIVSNFSVV